MPITNTFIILATFTSPEQICPNPQAMLWLLPLTAAIALVYKATKMPKFTTGAFLKEAAILFGSIVAFLIITAWVLFTLAWLISM
ncbi:MAG: hypothetical protein PHY02_02885 [Phycisphaerae bacterium]|nr:hypothetical protein [Phycisphaerae bacterium]